MGRGYNEREWRPNEDTSQGTNMWKNTPEEDGALREKNPWALIWVWFGTRHARTNHVWKNRRALVEPLKPSSSPACQSLASGGQNKFLLAHTGSPARGAGPLELELQAALSSRTPLNANRRVAKTHRSSLSLPQISICGSRREPRKSCQSRTRCFNDRTTVFGSCCNAFPAWAPFWADYLFFTSQVSHYLSVLLLARTLRAFIDAVCALATTN